MKIDQHSSLKIDILRFPLIFGVILIHMGDNYSNFIVDNNNLGSIPYKYVINLFSNVILLVAVPLFFVISGFLFFASFQPNFNCYQKKLKSRVKTILIPYLFWNIAYLLFKLAIQITPQLSSLIGGDSKRMLDYNLFDYFDALFGYTNFPVSYQFWFMRDLMILFILSPLIWILCKQFSWFLIGLLFIIWCFNLDRLVNIHNESWLFFSVGCVIAQKKYDLRGWDNYRYGIVFIYTMLSFALTTLITLNIQTSLLENVVTIIGVVAIWNILDVILKSNNIQKSLQYLSGYAFFIYAAHEPTLGILVKLITKILDTENSQLTLMMYLFCPIVIVLFLWLIALGLKRIVPRFYLIVSGSR